MLHELLSVKVVCMHSRFILSHPKDLKEAEDAARSTLKWRKEKAALLKASICIL